MDRGFSYLADNANSQARRDRWINEGYQSLLEEADFPFEESTATGAAPLTIADLRDVRYVGNTDGELVQRSRQEIMGWNASQQTQTGNASYWYQDGSQIKVWPLDTRSITVRYLRTPPDLSAAGDTPIVPARYHDLIVDFAVLRALRDRSNYQEADALWQAMQVDLTRMRTALLGQDPMFQRITDPTAV